MDPTRLPAQDAPELLGSCSCSAVKLRMRGYPTDMSYCHCRECRKISGNPYVTWGLWHNSAVHFDIKDNALVENVVSPIAVRGFCKLCFSHLYLKYHARPDGTNLALGLLDVRDDATNKMLDSVPKEHLFCKDDGGGASGALPPEADIKIVRYDEWDPEYEVRLKAWTDAGKPKRDDLLQQ